MVEELIKFGLGILEILKKLESDNNLVFIVIVVSIVQFFLILGFYLSFIYIRDKIYRSVLLDWVNGHAPILRDNFFNENLIHAIVDERTRGLTIKLNRVSDLCICCAPFDLWSSIFEFVFHSSGSALEEDSGSSAQLESI